MHAKDLIQKSTYILIATIILLASWHIFSLLLRTPALPVPLAALQSFARLLPDELMPHLTISFYRVALSLLIATVLGVPMGLYLGKNQKADEFSAPLIYMTYPIPKVVFLPIFLILLGIGNISKIVLITLVIFYLILVTTRDAARNLSKEYVLSVRGRCAPASWNCVPARLFSACRRPF